MSFIAWILLGLVAGLLGGKIVNRRGQNVFLDVFLGITGALAGGFLFQMVGLTSLTGLDIWSLLVATTGSVLLLVGYYAVRRVKPGN